MPVMKLDKLDHLVLPVSDIDRIANFYTKYLGMHKRTFGNGRVAISVEGILDAGGDCVLGDYSPLEIEDIAHEVYAILGEHQ